MEKETVRYQVVMSEETFDKIRKYKANLIDKKIDAGKYFKNKLSGQDISDMGIYQFIELLLSTKKPIIFAELGVKCDGSDWNSTEFAILGDICVAMDAVAYDNGEWSEQDCVRFQKPREVGLLFCPGPMLQTGSMGPLNNPDYVEVVQDYSIKQEKYDALIERRLLPLLAHVNRKTNTGKKGLVVIPGIGAGNFAGIFLGQMEEKLAVAVRRLLEKNRFPNIQCVQLGFYNAKFSMKPRTIHDTVYEVRATGLPQLSKPRLYGAQYSDCRLFKVVAWDHVSLPGNDFFHHNTRATDDGVSAAATNSMEIVTGVAGDYDKNKAKYFPPDPFEDWEEVAKTKEVHIIANEHNVEVVFKDGGNVSIR